MLLDTWDQVSSLGYRRRVLLPWSTCLNRRGKGTNPRDKSPGFCCFKYRNPSRGFGGGDHPFSFSVSARSSSGSAETPMRWKGPDLQKLVRSQFWNGHSCRYTKKPPGKSVGCLVHVQFSSPSSQRLLGRWPHWAAPYSHRHHQAAHLHWLVPGLGRQHVGHRPSGAHPGPLLRSRTHGRSLHARLHHIIHVFLNLNQQGKDISKQIMVIIQLRVGRMSSIVTKAYVLNICCNIYCLLLVKQDF